MTNTLILLHINIATLELRYYEKSRWSFYVKNWDNMARTFILLYMNILVVRLRHFFPLNQVIKLWQSSDIYRCIVHVGQNMHRSINYLVDFFGHILLAHISIYLCQIIVIFYDLYLCGKMVYHNSSIDHENSNQLFSRSNIKNLFTWIIYM